MLRPLRKTGPTVTFGLIFDLDDTLIEESTFQTSAIRAIARYLVEARGHDPRMVEHAISNSGPAGAMDRYQKILARLSEPTDPHSVQQLVRIHRDHEPDIDWHPEVPPLLQSLSKLDLRLAIITDGFAVTQRRKLEAVKAHEFFECIIVTDELAPNRAHWKPDTKPYLMACSNLGIPVERAIYVGDNPAKDFYVSVSLPITTVRLCRKNGVYTGQPYLGDIPADYEISALPELPEILEKIGVTRK